MSTYPMSLVTIICEALAREPVTRLVQAVGAHGYTLFPVEGQGSRGHRPADITEFANLQIEVILPPETAEDLLRRLHGELFPNFAMVAHVSEIRVLRRDKF